MLCAVKGPIALQWNILFVSNKYIFPLLTVNLLYYFVFHKEMQYQCVQYRLIWTPAIAGFDKTYFIYEFVRQGLLLTFSECYMRSFVIRL